MQLYVISSSKHQHMVVSALTHGYYLAMTFHCMCRFSLSSILHLHSPHHFFLYFILCAHKLHVYFLLLFLFHLIYLPILSLFLSPFLHPSALCQNSSLTPYLPIIYPFFTLISFPTFYTISFFIPFFLSYHLPFPFLSSLLLC